MCPAHLPRLLPLILPLALFCANGCATYEFDIVGPPEFKQHIGHEKEVVIEAQPVQYKLIAAEDRLVVQILNTGSDPLSVVGDQSTLIDPEGKKHGIPATTLAPGSQMKLILPPTPHLEPAPGRAYSGPSWADGLGYSDTTTDQAQFVTSYHPGEVPFDWPADSEVRMLLTFQRGQDKPFTQEWVYRKQKAQN